MDNREQSDNEYTIPLVNPDKETDEDQELAFKTLLERFHQENLNLRSKGRDTDPLFCILD